MDTIHRKVYDKITLNDSCRGMIKDLEKVDVESHQFILLEVKKIQLLVTGLNKKFRTIDIEEELQERQIDAYVNRIKFRH